MKLEPLTIQKIFVVWFMLLTMIACFNFYHNIKDGQVQSDLEIYYEQNRGRYEQAIADHIEYERTHKELQSEVDYLRGRLDERGGK